LYIVRVNTMRTSCYVRNHLLYVDVNFEVRTFR